MLRYLKEKIIPRLPNVSAYKYELDNKQDLFSLIENMSKDERKCLSIIMEILMKKKYLLIGSLILFLPFFMKAYKSEKENSFVKETKKICSKIITMQKNVVAIVKKHPFITMLAITIIINKKMQKNGKIPKKFNIKE